MAGTIELDTTKEAPSPNGHNDEWLEFDDDMAFINHVTSQEPKEKQVEIPEWKTKVLCRALSAEDLIKVQKIAYDQASKTTDYSRATYEVLMFGCFNPKTGRKVFRESSRTTIMSGSHSNGLAVSMLYVTVMRLTGLFASEVEQVRKN